jgi:hypothetical protein
MRFRCDRCSLAEWARPDAPRPPYRGGDDLAAASEALGVSVNALRTHLQRMFDKTGTRGRATLVRALLSAEAPIK